MSQSNRIFDEFARLMTDAAGMADGVRREAEGVMRSQLERLMQDMDIVSREEFDAVREMAVLAREENDRLAARVAALEARLAVAEAGSVGTAGSAKPGPQAKASSKASSSPSAGAKKPKP